MIFGSLHFANIGDKYFSIVKPILGPYRRFIGNISDVKPIFVKVGNSLKICPMKHQYCPNFGFIGELFLEDIGKM